MNPIELLRVGIAEGSWTKVCDGFQQLTGMQVSPPVEKPAGDQVALYGFLRGLHERIAVVLANGSVSAAADPDPPSDEVSTRAREVRDAVTNNTEMPVPEHRQPANEYEKFKVSHGNTKNKDGKSACKTMPFEPGMKNTFRDDGSIGSDLVEDSKQFSEKKQPEPRRDPVKQVTVTCSKCNKTENVPPIFAPRSLEKGDQSSYVCNNCIGRNPR
jgi:hypothetical protein